MLDSYCVRFIPLILMLTFYNDRKFYYLVTVPSNREKLQVFGMLQFLFKNTIVALRIGVIFFNKSCK